eukprot:CAMPEP_0196737478 /NCGR_PEP_ID=MMETSP1091-20130531/15198_1 /TAXON_ID=302021 /ORGANISM="Rhodomonas sp., Strain CCMP768" /LENGTH=1109 /DNA_ID=CAMNT_0042081333 /DNA_START=9 /DNA_END=3338 /DNA_ORIENTATION=+
MASYGSIAPQGNVEPPRRRGIPLKMALGAAVVLAIAACTLGVLTASNQESMKPVALELQPTHPPPADEEADEADDQSDAEPGTMPTAEDFASFEPAATEIVSYLGYTLQEIKDKTDLDESCGDLMLPCVANVGNCVESNIHTVEGSGRLELDPETCQCFASGLTNQITLDDGDVVTCPYLCMEALSNIFDEKLFAHNEDSHTTVACPRTFMNMARSVYGTANGEFPVEHELDGEQVLPVDDEKVIRAAAALQEHINLIRKQECSLKPQLSGDPTILFDEKGTAKGDFGQYRLEVSLGEGGQLFTGRVVHLPKDDQLLNPSEVESDPQNLLGRFRVMRLSPDPCADGAAASLAITQSQVKAINSQQLSWKAAWKPEHEGVTSERFGMGIKAPSAEERKKKTIQNLNAPSTDLPAAYDARDHRDHQTFCRAYDVMDQGSCGSCYAFAAATALGGRICRSTEHKWNVIMSPQEMMDCNNGCDGGWPLDVFEHISNDAGFSVENFCDPYLSEKQVCGGTCAAGNDFHGLDGTAYMVGDATPAGIEAMMREIMLHGPGVMTMEIYDDFNAYSSGVYTKTSNNYKGLHGMAVIGWGTEDGVDYWLLQNSWGSRVGDEGTWKIRRGTNEVAIESYGMAVVTPELPSECAQTTCSNGGTPLKDCSCRCKGGWTGPTCDTCSMTCKFGGVLADNCYSCYCPPGTWGTDCGGKAEMSTTGICQGAHAPLDVTFSYETTEPPTQMSFLGIYATDVDVPFAYDSAGNFVGYTHLSMAYVCGTSYDPTVNDGRCTNSFSVSVPVWSLAPGDYKVALLQYLPPNEFGESGFETKIVPADVLGVITVTADCSAATMDQIAEDNDMMALFPAAVAAKQQEEAAAQAEANQRLDAAEAVSTTILAEGSPSLEIAGTDGINPIVWSSSGPMTVCAVIPLSMNTNPKHLILFVGDGSSGSFYETGLVNQGPAINAPESNEFCVETGVSPGIPGGHYTIGLQSSQLLASVQFTNAFAWVGIMEYNPGQDFGYNYLDIKILWQVTEAQAQAYDSIQVKDSAGNLMAWFYTSCSCDTQVGATAVPNAEHTLRIWMWQYYVPGGLTVSFHPNSGAFIAATAPAWIPWASIGW